MIDFLILFLIHIFLKALKVTQAEASVIANCFSSNSFSNFQSNGVIVEGQKYQFLRGEDGKLVLAKKKGSGSLTLQSSKSGAYLNAVRSLESCTIDIFCF